MFMGQSIKKDTLVWFRNEYADENAQDNSNKPFYMVIHHALNIFRLMSSEIQSTHWC